jgi:hypothetical protein
MPLLYHCTCFRCHELSDAARSLTQRQIKQHIRLYGNTGQPPATGEPNAPPNPTSSVQANNVGGGDPLLPPLPILVGEMPETRRMVATVDMLVRIRMAKMQWVV